MEAETTPRWGWLVVAGLLPVLVVVADLLGGRGPFDEGPPRLDLVGLARAVVLTLAVVALLRSVAPEGATTPTAPWPRRAAVLVGLAAAVAAGTVGLFLNDPMLFHDLGQEDGTVENVTALAFVVGGALLVAAARRWRGAPRAVVAVYGAVMVLGGLEEVSYGQRWLGFQGPSVITGNNLQNEVTLHNIATDPTEAAFYAGAIAVLVLLPTLVHWSRTAPRLGWLAPLAPAAWPALVAAPAMGLTHEMWDTVPVQLAYWTAVGAVAVLAFGRSRRDRLLVVLSIVMTVVVQASALWQGDFVELHDVTEFKELYLGLLVLLQGVLVLRHGRDVRPTARAEPGVAS